MFFKDTQMRKRFSSGRDFHRRTAGIALILGGLVFSGPPSALAENPAQVSRTLEQAIEMDQRTQKNEDQWADRKSELIARQQTLTYAVDNLQRERDILIQRREVAQKLLAEARRGVESARAFEQDLEPFLDATLTRLENFVERDLPFLPDERRERLRNLRETLVRVDASSAEKLRRVMEALQVELTYGHTVEAYQDTIDLEGTPLLMDMLRVGRVSLFCCSPDGSVVGQYDRVSGKFVPLPKEAAREVGKALEIARRERTADLVDLPIGRIEK